MTPDVYLLVICDICLAETKFAVYAEFHKHIFSTHENSLSLEKRYECKICLKKCRTEHDLDFHFNVHIKSEVLRHICKYSKLKSFFPPDAGEVSPCKLCKKVVANDSLEDHIRCTHGECEKIIKCPL